MCQGWARSQRRGGRGRAQSRSRCAQRGEPTPGADVHTAYRRSMRAVRSRTTARWSRASAPAAHYAPRCMLQPRAAKRFGGRKVKDATTRRRPSAVRMPCRLSSVGCPLQRCRQVALDASSVALRRRRSKARRGRSAARALCKWDGRRTCPLSTPDVPIETSDPRPAPTSPAPTSVDATGSVCNRRSVRRQTTWNTSARRRRESRRRKERET